MSLGRWSTVPDACFLTLVGTAVDAARPTANEEGPVDKEHNADKLFDNDENVNAERWVLSSKGTKIGTKYVKSAMERSGIQLLQPTRVRKAYKRKKEYGLFSLFFTGAMFERILQWANGHRTLAKKMSLAELK